MNWYVTIKMVEWVIWLSWACYFIRKSTLSKGWICPALAGTLLIFSFADFAEYFTRGHFPWWLWTWKILGGLLLFGVLVVDDYFKRGALALSPWRFVAASVILVIAVRCWLLTGLAS